MPHQGEKWFLDMFYSFPSMYYKETLINIEPYDPYFLPRDSYSFPLQQNIKWDSCKTKGPNFIYVEPMPLTLLLRLVGEKEWSTENTGHAPAQNSYRREDLYFAASSLSRLLSYDFYCSNQHWDQVSVGKKVCFLFHFHHWGKPG